jgi:hypothetical protein
MRQTPRHVREVQFSTKGQRTPLNRTSPPIVTLYRSLQERTALDRVSATNTMGKLFAN